MQLGGAGGLNGVELAQVHQWHTVGVHDGHDFDDKQAAERPGAGVVPPQEEEHHAVAQVAGRSFTGMHAS